MENKEELDEEMKRRIKERDEMIARNLKRAEEERPKPGTLLYIYEQNRKDIKKLRDERRAWIAGQGF